MFGSIANKARAVLMLILGPLIALGVLPEDAQEVLVTHVDVAIGGLLAAWGAVLAVREWWGRRDDE